jgi:hypothetical protein
MSLWVDNGTVTVNNGSATVVGVGTTFLDKNVLSGYAFRGPNGILYEIQSVNSNTNITLAENYVGTSGSGQGYAIIQTTYAFAANIINRVQALIAAIEAGIATPTLRVGSPATPGVVSAFKGLRHVFENAGDVTLDVMKAALSNTAYLRWFTGATNTAQMGLNGSGDLVIMRGAAEVCRIPADLIARFNKGLALDDLASTAMTIDGQIAYDATAGALHYRHGGYAIRLGTRSNNAHYIGSIAKYNFVNASSPGDMVPIAGVANIMEISQWIPPRTVTLDAVTVRVVTGVASAQGKIVMYESDENGRPTTRIFETAALDFSANNTNPVSAQSVTLVAGRPYWIGVRHSSTASINYLPTGSASCLGFASVPNAPLQTLRRTLAFGTAAPANWVWTNAEESVLQAPAVYLSEA